MHRLMPKSIVFASLIIPTFLFAGVYGKIAGRVIDKETGKPLENVNVYIPGTTYGAATDKHGEYFILKVPPGEYTVRAERIGYRPVDVKGIIVRTDLTTRVDFALEPTAIEVPGIVVVAERPLIQPDVTASVRYVSRKEIATTPKVESFEDIVALQPGAVGRGREIHIRGGRSGEILYVVDGIPIRHPIYGGTAAFDLDVISIQEIEMLTGGFNAEYGQAQSAVVNIVTREGGPKLSGELIYKSDNLAPKRYSFNTDYGAVSFGGPIPVLDRIVPGDLRFFISGNFKLTDTYYNNHRTREKIEILPGIFEITERQENKAGLNLKLTYQPTKAYKFAFGYRRTGERWSRFDWYWKDMPDSLPISHRFSEHATFSFIHTVSPKTFYTLHLGYLKTRYYSWLHTPPEFWRMEVTPEGDTIYTSTPWGWDTDGDGFCDLGADSRYRDDISYVYTLKYDITSQIHPRHLVKSGIEINYHDVNYIDIQYPGSFRYPGRDTVPGPYPEYGLYRWCFEGYPIKGAAYVQDKMEFEGLIVNVGLRVDYFTPGETVTQPDYLRQWQAITQLPLEVKRHRIQISPRLGMSHPISDKTVIYFAYGHFSQIPELQYFYRDPWTGTWVGNPNLKPEVTVAYEVGISHKITRDMAVDFKLFMKDISDYVGLVKTGDPPVWVWINKGYGRAKGLEIHLRKRYSRFTSGSIAYTLQWANGYASSAFMECYRVWSGMTIPIRERPLDWDQRHSIVMIANLEVPKGEHPMLFGKKLPDDWSISILWRFGSGLPYTPGGKDPQIYENSAHAPYTSTVDLKMEKGFRIDNLDIILFTGVSNLLDNQNVTHLWCGFNTWTGEPYKYGDANEAYRQIYSWKQIYAMRNPYVFDPGRQIELGVGIKW